MILKAHYKCPKCGVELSLPVRIDAEPPREALHAVPPTLADHVMHDEDAPLVPPPPLEHHVCHLVTVRHADGREARFNLRHRRWE